ncbi:MAG: hypothetical protein GXP04_13650 [Alphaproteobacteria bacterium]|nr:hypothetical protein [Alphaproteobacteria bacterium]
MIRITTIFLCLLLAAAAAGRYRAEVSVKETRSELKRLELSKVEELRSIQILRADVAYLENPQRLSEIANSKTDLRPSERGQILTAREFAVLMNGVEFDEKSDPDFTPSDVITNAIAMAQISDAR